MQKKLIPVLLAVTILVLADTHAFAAPATPPEPAAKTVQMQPPTPPQPQKKPQAAEKNSAEKLPEKVQQPSEQKSQQPQQKVDDFLTTLPVSRAPVNAFVEPSPAADANSNGIPDEWEKKYDVSVARGDQDTDGDGLSDRLEYAYGTDPTKADTDGDGFTDTEELFDYGTDPKTPNKTIPEKIAITNFQDGTITADPTLLVKGVGSKSGETVRLFAENQSGAKATLGTTAVDRDRKFLIDSSIPLLDGRYNIFVEEFENQLTTQAQGSSKKISIEIDATRGIATPTPKELAGETISKEVVLRNIRLEIKDRVPLLRGQTDVGNAVFITWKSLLMSATLLADATGGDFVSIPPRSLDDGPHEVYIYAVRPGDFVRSQDALVHFNVQSEQERSAKKNLPPWVWLAMGVGGIFILSIAAGLLRKKA